MDAVSPPTGELGASRGQCAERFEDVGRAFQRVLGDGSAGAVSVFVDGDSVVDLYGPAAGDSRDDAWQERSLVTAFSCTKGMVSLCVHLLASVGEVDLSAPLAAVWPEFAAAGKRDVTPRMWLNHSAGLPGLSDTPSPEELRDDQVMAERLAAEPALWAPGTRHGYHAITVGWALGELVRRVVGVSVGAFFKEQLADPLGLPVWIGVPQSEVGRVRTVQLSQDSPSGPYKRALDCGEPVQRAAHAVRLVALDQQFVNQAETWRSEIPATGAVCNARGLAGLYSAVSHADRAAALGFDQLSLARMRATECIGFEDAVDFEPFCFSAGFQKARPPSPFCSGLVVSPEAFGHGGLGGSIGLADPSCDMSFAFVTDHHASGPVELDRAQLLIDALYRALGFRQRDARYWAR